MFKKGARVIKEDHNGEWETLKLYVCVVNQTTPNQWISSEWDVVYQEVGIAWIPRDHKEVYYDDGGNKNKWHKMMYFIPDYYDGQKTDEEIAVFNENQTYHFGERAIHTTLIGETYCYTYDSNIPRRAEWAAGWWSKDENVDMYETYKTYYKGDEVIKKNVEAGYQDIQEYQDEMYFEQGKYTLSIIDREHDVAAIANFHDILYIERIFADESLYGVYKSNKTTSGSFNWQDWDLQASNVIQTRGRDHNMVPIHTEENTGITCRYCGKFITGYKQKDIKEYNYESGYEEGELVIWTFNDEDSVFGLLECQKPIPQVIGPGEYNPDTAPPNSEYWSPISQFVEQANTLRVFKATKAMDASINTHFIRENWAIVSQKMEPDYDLYGVIWEKYGVIGGGGAPFGYAFPTYGGSMYYSGDLTERRGRFAYFLTTSTNAKFNAYQTYIMRTDYGNVPGITGWAITYTLDNSTGFHKMITKNGVAYGIPSWGSQLAANYIYFKLFDDWQRVTLPCYIVINELDTFNSDVQKNIGYLSITAVNNGFISLKLVDLYTRQGIEHSFRTKLSHFIIGLDGSYLSDNIIEINDAELQDELHYHTFSQRICFYNSDIIYARDLIYIDDAYIVTDGYWTTYIKLQKSYLINENGEAAIASDAVNGYENHIFNKFIHFNFSSYNYSRNEVEDIVSVGAKVNYNLVYRDNLEWITEDRVPTLSEFYNIANTMGLNVVIVNDRHALENCPVGVDCYPIQNAHDNFENISNSSHYELIFFSYGFYTDSDDYYKIRVRIRFRSLGSLGINDTIVFEEIYNTELSRSQIQNALYNDELIDYSKNLPIKFDSIGRVGSKYYFLITEPGSLGYYSTYVSESFMKFTNSTNFCEIWAVDLVGKTLEKVTTNGFRYIILRYVNNGSVNIDGHHVTHLKLLLSTYEYYNRGHIDYELRENEENSYNLIKYMRIDDRNLFSNSAGSSVSTFTGGIFLTEHFQSNIGATFGIFIYLPIFNMASKTIMESTGFFWLSSGNETAFGSGDFYGGYQYDSTNFDLPLVF